MKEMQKWGWRLAGVFTKGLIWNSFEVFPIWMKICSKPTRYWDVCSLNFHTLLKQLSRFWSAKKILLLPIFHRGRSNSFGQKIRGRRKKSYLLNISLITDIFTNRIYERMLEIEVKSKINRRLPDWMHVPHVMFKKFLLRHGNIVCFLFAQNYRKS